MQCVAGFSDPYCEVKIDGERKFTTSVKKKTLNPVWNEFVTLELPKADSLLKIVSLSLLHFFSISAVVFMLCLIA